MNGCKFLAFYSKFNSTHVETCHAAPFLKFGYMTVISQMGLDEETKWCWILSCQYNVSRVQFISPDYLI